jgi:hypothetical protein
MITESDALAKAIDDAARLWPEVKDERAELLRRLIDRGIESVEAEFNEQIEARRKTVMEVAGSLSGIWPANWREEMRAGWPE